MKHIREYNFKGQTALVRLDLNVPLNDNFEVTDSTRINAALPTILKIVKDGGKAILMSHLGRPKGVADEKFSLKHTLKVLSEKLNQEVQFVGDCIGKEVKEKVAQLQAGDILLLENLRFHKEEKEGDAIFANKLADLADVYVNDAFGTAHRAHASTSIVAQYFGNEKMFGFLIENELKAIEKVTQNTEQPFTAIMGGAKISDKILLIEKLLDKVDNLIIGGGMSYTFFKSMGGDVGNSLVEIAQLDLAQHILQLAKEKGVQLCLAPDSKAAISFDNNAESIFTNNMEIPEGYMGLDIGPKAIEKFSSIIENSKTIMWNGPMGVFEFSNFADGTKGVAQAIAKATEKGAYSLIGGGDSAAAINQLNFADKVSYISTGGGALLEYLEGKTLPGIAAIET